MPVHTSEYIPVHTSLYTDTHTHTHTHIHAPTSMNTHQQPTSPPQKYSITLHHSLNLQPATMKRTEKKFCRLYPNHWVWSEELRKFPKPKVILKTAQVYVPARTRAHTDTHTHTHTDALSLYLSHKHTCMHTKNACTHTHTHTRITYISSYFLFCIFMTVVKL